MITNKDKAKAIKKKKDKAKAYTPEGNPAIAQAFHKMLDDFHALNVNNDYKLDVMLLQDEIEQMTDGRSNLRGTWDETLPTFSPSSADDCERSLAFKIIGADEDEQVMEPYQKRWVRNGSAVHRAMQRDLIYIEKYLQDAPFEVCRTKEGKPAWERNTRTVKQFEHNGEKFQLYGMVDGMLYYKPEKKRIGFDFKTKSTTIASIGDYKLKAPQENNVLQAVCYSLLFDVNEYIICYESLAKDSWTKGAEARPDIRVFHIKITDSMKIAILDKFAGIAKQLRQDKLPAPDFEKCLFCTFKEVCSVVEKGAGELGF
ncbi:PD-(D/E)XK nuclease family protein [Neobacillus vireti]|uniref:PD-(D/E)XK nuclease family protein n=1 Tax=Neobacillus vireti TaxID=220686 RepID=UPI002FFDCBC3